jgi:hypothetical protein
MRRIVLALVTLAVLLPSVAQARACWMTDVYVRQACCCPPPDAASEAPVPTVQSVCCELQKRSDTQLPIAHTAAPPAIAAVLVSAITIVPVAPPLRTVAVAITPRAQAPPSSTLLAQHRGLLL